MRFSARAILVAAVLALLAGTASAQNYAATLEGLQEVPPNASPATGAATLSLSPTKMLTVHIDFSGLIGSLTASHIHGPAPAGVNAGVRFGLIPPAPAASPVDVIVGPLSAADETNLNSGLFYINIHSSVFPGGEIRGQIFRDQVGVERGTWSQVKSLFQ